MNEIRHYASESAVIIGVLAGLVLWFGIMPVIGALWMLGVLK